MIARLVLIPLFPILGYAPTAEIYYVPLLLLVLVAFVVGVTLTASITLVYMRDLRFAVPLILQFGIFVTPVAYNAEVVANTPAKMMLYFPRSTCSRHRRPPPLLPLRGGASMVAALRRRPAPLILGRRVS